jgi:hypothetical protein
MERGRTVYLMVRDRPGADDEASLEWGVDWDLDEGEELPEDHEELSNAQFTIFQFMQTLKGTFEEAGAEVIRGDAPSGFAVPKET